MPRTSASQFGDLAPQLLNEQVCDPRVAAPGPLTACEEGRKVVLAIDGRWEKAVS